MANISSEKFEQCIKVPPTISSKGWLNGFDASSTYTLPKLELQMALILVISQACHFLLRKLGVPIFTSQIIAGLVVGPWLKHIKWLDESDPSVRVIGTVAALGYGLFIFLSAVKTDMSIIKNSGIRPVIIGTTAFLIPTAFSVYSITEMMKNKGVGFNIASFLMGSTFPMSSFPVIAMLLDEMKILNSELGRLGLSSALVSDILGIFMPALGAIFKEAIGGTNIDMIFAIVKIIALVCAVVVLRWGMKLLIKAIPEDRNYVNDTFVYGVLFLFLAAVATTHYNGVFLILLPYILGLAVPEGPPLGSAVVNKIEFVVSNLLVPVSVATISMRFDFSLVDFGNSDLVNYSLISLTTLFVKFFVSFILSLLLCKMPIKDAAALAFILNSKGIVELGFYSMNNDGNMMSTGEYTIISIGFIVTATIGPVLVKLLHDPSRKYAAYQKKNLISLKINDDVQIVTCIQVPEDINPTINLLNVASPTRENPIIVNVLHLVKLIGRSSPIFIAHERKPKTVNEVSYFENAIVLFYQFEQNNWGAVSVNAFTAVSPASSMNEDVCNLALDKQASLILLPFHRKWSFDGTIESEDIDVRTLNSTILEMSPCSVGIFIDRSVLRRQYAPEEVALGSPTPLIKVAMIFLGGDDDREALVFAKRVTYAANASLNVIVVKAERENDVPEWERMLDSYILREAKNTPGLRFTETIVPGGDETATVLRSVAREYDMVVVGRRNNVESRQTSGLEEWSEFPELGIVGDLLASHDLEGTCSILVIQQQKVDT